jgi:D-alanyl-D-alanine carboxypeptidase
MHLRKLAIGALFITVSAFSIPARASDEAATAQLQQVVDDYLAQNGQTEKITGIELQVSLCNGDQVIEVASGNDGLPHPQPMTPGSLFQIGSNTKSFTAALILKLEVAGKLDIDQTVGDWLPQYPAWQTVTIRRLLNMTSGVPSYDATVTIAEKMVDLRYQFTPQQLIASVDPDQGSTITQPIPGYSYTNTAYFLAGLIIEKASGMSYKEALEKMILKPLKLRDTYYFYGPTPHYVLDRVAAGFFNDPSCLVYQPGCNPPDYQPPPTSVLAPLIGKDVRAENMSWAGPAGGIIATLGDLAQWYRALFGLRVIPQVQLDEMETLVSTLTGLPLPVPTTADPGGYGLGVTEQYSVSYFRGFAWYYEGETEGYRVVFAYWPQYDMVITMVANSNVPTENFPKTVLPAALDALINTGTIGQW